MLWAAISFSALNLDRNNLSQANTDNFLPDLGLTTDGAGNLHSQDAWDMTSLMQIITGEIRYSSWPFSARNYPLNLCQSGYVGVDRFLFPADSVSRWDRIVGFRHRWFCGLSLQLRNFG